MKNIKIYISLVLAVFVSTTSCDFGNVNVDPTQVSNVALKDVLPTALLQTGYNIGSNAGRICGITMQQLAGFDAQQVQYQNYTIAEDALNNYWQTGLYVGAMKDCDVLMKQAESQDAPAYGAIARILMAQNLGSATAFWGDIPFSEAFKGSDNFKPVFDTQESIYGSIQTLLNDAITMLGQPSGGIVAPPGGDDIIFGGDKASWIRVANALKARYLMHTIKKQPGNNALAITALGSALTSNAQNPDVLFGNSVPFANSLAKFGAERPKTIIVRQAFVDELTAKSDPRLGLYAQSDGTEWLFYTSGSGGLFWTSFDSPLPLISYPEVKFLEAETELRAGNVANAEAALTAAITANMQQMGIASGSYSAYVTAYGDFSGLASEAERLERIIEEKAIAMFGQGWMEVFTDYRRTGYPAISPEPNPNLGLDPSGIVPRRFIYPISESDRNNVNIEDAIARQGNGTGLLDDPLWAFD